MSRARALVAEPKWPCVFPLPPAPHLPGPVASAAKPAAATLAGLSVLVIDDIEDARETLRVLLQQLGAKVSVARDGREGLDMVRDAEPDLVLCDLRMPRMDGFAFMRELHQRRIVSASARAGRDRSNERCGPAAHTGGRFQGPYRQAV